MKKILLLAISLLLIAIPVIALSADASRPEDLEDLYDYDVSDGVYIFRAKERKVDQLTAEQLSLPTSELVDLILEFPYWSSFGISTRSSAETYEMITTAYDYNGFAELEKRPDAASVMLGKFSELIKTLNEELVFKGRDCLHANYLDAILSVPLFADQLSPEEQLEYEGLSAEFWDAITAEVSLPDCTAENVNSVAETGIYDTQNRDNITYQLACYGSTTGGNQVPLYTASSDFTPYYQQYYAEEYAAIYGVQILGYATAKYNCHSYAWYQPYTSNAYWIYDIWPFLYDAHCSVIETGVPSVGSIVIYLGSNNNMVHSAIVTSIQNGIITCKSKWGPMGLYSHVITNVPPDYYYDLQNNEIRCTFFNYSRNHTCSITIDDRYTHTRTCLICGWTSTEPHIENVITGRCIVCGLQGPFPALAFSSPITYESNAAYLNKYYLD